MLKANKFECFLDNSSSLCFKVLANDNNFWVVRAKKKTKNTKRLYNEFLARKLGLDIGIISPKVEIIELSDNLLRDLEDKLENDSESIDISMNKAVATEFINNLSSIDPPPNILFFDESFPDANLENLLKIFGQEYDFDNFYGFLMFSVWILLEDEKYENLCISDEMIPIFIDFDCAFMGTGWDSLPQKYEFSLKKIDAPYFLGIDFKIENFDKWIVRLRKLDKTYFQDVLKNIPKEWNVPSNYSTDLLTLLFDQKEDFINEFIKFIDNDQRGKYFKRIFHGL